MPELKLDDNLREVVCAFLADGHQVREACLLAGIGKTTMYRWISTGQADEAAGCETVYTAFAEAVTLAEAELEASCLAKIRAAAENPRSWTAAAWLLERRFPDRFSLRNRIQVSGPDGEAITFKFVYEVPKQIGVNDTPKQLEAGGDSNEDSFVDA